MVLGRSSTRRGLQRVRLRVVVPPLAIFVPLSAATPGAPYGNTTESLLQVELNMAAR
jgi:hypothetical protein